MKHYDLEFFEHGGGETQREQIDLAVEAEANIWRNRIMSILENRAIVCIGEKSYLFIPDKKEWYGPNESETKTYITTTELMGMLF